MNRGNCRKITEIPKCDWCVIDNENNKVLAKYVTKGSAIKEASKFNELGENLVRVEQVENPLYKEFWG